MKKIKKIEVIYQDDQILVINKPAGMSVTKDRSGLDDVVMILTEQLGVEKLRLIHRLDKYTSGAMMLAKTLEAQSKYSSYFEKRQIKKTYLALVSGFITAPNGTIRVPIARSRKDPKVMQVDPRGKAAITNWKLIAEFGMLSLLAVEPLTGRTHQIRVHMANKGMPLAYDRLYGGTRPIMLSEYKDKYRHKKDREERPLIERETLHAYQLEIPAEGDTPTVFTAKLDKKFSATIKMLTRHNPAEREAFADKADYDRIINGQAF